MTKNEMIEKRANLWKAMNAFLDTQIYLKDLLHRHQST